MQSEKWARRIFFAIMVLLVVLFLYLFHLLASILIPLVLAVITLFLLQPFIRKMRKTGFPSVFSSIFVLTVFFVFVVIFFVLFYFSFQRFIADFPDLLTHLNQNLLVVVREIAGKKWMQHLVDEEQLLRFFSEGWGSISNGKAILSTLLGTLNIFKAFGLFVIYLIFMLIWVSNFGRKIDKAFPLNAFKIKRVLSTVTGNIQSYIIIKTLVSLITGILSLGVCLLFGLDYAFLWGFVFFTFNFIPYIGSTVAVLLPVTVSVVQFQSFPLTLALFVILVIVQQIIGTFLEPILQSEGSNLSPFMIVLSVLLWGYIWGIPGVILAIPIMSAINLVFGTIDSLKPISVFMSSSKKTRH